LQGPANALVVLRGPPRAILSYTILTTDPNEMIAVLHDRMRVILGEDEWVEWLAAESGVDSLRAMCIPCPSRCLTAEQNA
jgi:putative SOS response-associated peptidase YedK